MPYTTQLLGNLDRRGVGDLRTLTVAEYEALARKGRLGYRLQRNPLVMFGLGPIVAMIIGPRIVAKGARPRMRRSVLATDVALGVIVALLVWLIGWRDYLLVSACRHCSPAPSGSGCSTFSTSSRTPTGTTPAMELHGRRAAGKLLPEAAGPAAVLHRQHRLPPRPSPQRADPPLPPQARPRREPGAPRRADAEPRRGSSSNETQALRRAEQAPGHLPRRPTGPQRSHAHGAELMLN